VLIPGAMEPTANEDGTAGFVSVGSGGGGGLAGIVGAGEYISRVGAGSAGVRSRSRAASEDAGVPRDFSSSENFRSAREPSEATAGAGTGTGLGEEEGEGDGSFSTRFEHSDPDLSEAEEGGEGKAELSARNVWREVRRSGSLLVLPVPALVGPEAWQILLITSHTMPSS